MKASEFKSKLVYLGMSMALLSAAYSLCVHNELRCRIDHKELKRSGQLLRCEEVKFIGIRDRTTVWDEDGQSLGDAGMILGSLVLMPDLKKRQPVPCSMDPEACGWAR